MRYEIDPDVVRLIADSRAAIDASRRHLSQIKRELKDAEALNDAIRRDIAMWHRSVQK